MPRVVQTDEPSNFADAFTCWRAANTFNCRRIIPLAQQAHDGVRAVVTTNDYTGLGQIRKNVMRVKESREEILALFKEAGFKNNLSKTGFRARLSGLVGTLRHALNTHGLT
jgi:hypothetical protein